MRLFLAALIAILSTCPSWGQNYAAEQEGQNSEEPIIVVDTPDCAMDAPEGSSDFERRVWHNICVSKSSSPSEYNLNTCADTDSDINELSNYALSADFLATILTDPNYVVARKSPDVKLFCVNIPYLDLEEQQVPGSLQIQNSVLGYVNLNNARVDGTLDLRGSHVSSDVWANKLSTRLDFAAYGARFGAAIELNDADIGGSIDFAKSKIVGGVSARRVRVSRDIYLSQGAKLDWVNLTAAQIGGTLNASGSTFEGKFNAPSVETGNSVFLRGGATFGDVNLIGARIGGNLEAIGSEFHGKFNAESISTGGSIRLDGGAKFEEVVLRGAYAHRNLEVVGSSVSGILSADGLKVDGSVLLGGGATFGEVNLGSAEIGRNLGTNGSTFKGLFDANSIKVGGSVWMTSGAAFETLSLRNARLSGSIELTGSTFSGPFLASGLQVAGSAYFRDGATFEDLLLIGSKIEGMFQLQGSIQNGDVDLTEAALGSISFWLGQSRSGKSAARDTVWGPKAKLILRNAKTGSLQARMGGEDSWTRSDDSPLPTDLTGFQYDQLGGFTSGAEHDLALTDADALVDWIEKSATANGMIGYRPQPYRALEAALRDQGAESAATKVAYARLIHRADTRVSADWRTNFGAWLYQQWLVVFDRFLQITIGFGVYPHLAFYWFLTLVAVGVAVARRCPALTKPECACASWGDAIFYSLGNATPLMAAPQDYQNIVHDGWAKVYFNVQRVFGFILASVLLGALTLGV